MESRTTPVADPVTDFTAMKPGTAGLLMLVPAVVLLAITGWLGYKGFGGGARSEPAAVEKDKDPAAVKPAGDPNAGDYLWGFIFALAAAAPFTVVGVGLLATPPKDDDATRTRARMLLLAAGGLAGIALMLAGMVFFVRWVDGLVKYFDDGGTKDLRWVLYALVMLVIGAGLLFAAVQPARAEERNHPQLRRLVYGSNLALVLLLLITVLVAGNVVAARKVPNKLDTTETGFYTLSPETQSFFENLDQPVTAYGILPDGGEGDLGRIVDDTRRLLVKCQEASNGKFTVRLFGSTTTRSEYERLQQKYPEVELNGAGVLLTAGEDEKRHAFIRLGEFRAVEGQGPNARETFVGESRLLKELAFLTENKSKPIVYFTQSNGELIISDPKPEGDNFPKQTTARKLKEYLEKNFIAVKPLEFKIEQPEVPADASVVVVAQPVTPLRKESVTAIRKFLTEPRADGKKGKLIVLAGTPVPPAGAVPKTGLEDLLKEFNILLGDRYLYGERTDDLPSEAMAVRVYPPAIQAGNPVAKAFARFEVPMIGCRAVNPLKDRQEFQAQPVLMTSPGRYTWEEETPLADSEQTWLDIRKSPTLQRSKRLAQSRPVAVFTSEGATGRVAAFGNALFLTDVLAGETGTPKQFELFGGTIDWLRDRSTVAPGVASKTYTDFHLNPRLDLVRLQWLPLGLALFAILGIGAGVWVIRRS